MAFISVAEELSAKGMTEVENKFITKYLPVLDANAVKVYLFALYISQSGKINYSVEDLAKRLEMSEEDVRRLKLNCSTQKTYTARLKSLSPKNIRLSLPPCSR